MSLLGQGRNPRPAPPPRSRDGLLERAAADWVYSASTDVADLEAELEAIRRGDRDHLIPPPAPPRPPPFVTETVRR